MQRHVSGSQCWCFRHEPSSLFHHGVLVGLGVSMMMCWRVMMDHYTNRILVVSCARNCTWVWGGGLLAVGDPWAPGGLLATGRSGVVVLV